MSYTSQWIRQDFLDFFHEKEHLIVPSASLVPVNDPTLLFTNAGMNQFKSIFLGLARPAASRIADSQKCMRVSGKHNDLEDVGPSPYHHTFFEMLGNWSFGNYYKKEAIHWAWELLTSRWKLPKERLYASVFKDDKGDLGLDEETANYWRSETDITPEHILSFGRKDNFWEMGETGPCGPCSEIHYDRGPEYCNLVGKPGHVCGVNRDCRRFIELWNLVFIQYNRRPDGILEPLPAKHVDTGMGLERVSMVLQGGKSNYDTDLFAALFDHTQHLLGHTAEQRRQHDIAYRVIADHGRAITFMIGDGVMPGNEGRSYVLRLILRRAARFGRKAGFTRPFLADIADKVIEIMSDHYSELKSRRRFILNVITQEEERFYTTYENGLQQLNELVEKMKVEGKSVIPGAEAFKLHATYGFPIELTRLMAADYQFSVDDEGFKQAMEEHGKISATGSFKMTDEKRLGAYARLAEKLKSERLLDTDGVHYDPYRETPSETTILALLKDGVEVPLTREGEEIEIVLADTGFYVESGGQETDTGRIISADGGHGNAAASAEVLGVYRPVEGLIIHEARMLNGELHVSAGVRAVVDVERRLDIRRNHTATHLLQAALRSILGEHVHQSGSLVAPERLRFDFSHPQGLTAEELKKVENEVNRVILAGLPVSVEVKGYQQAVAEGAMALFGEKYGDVVRMIRVGEETAYSKELCGGTHVSNTMEIGSLRIVDEGSVAAGIRRIEAVTGRYAYRFVEERLDVLQRTAMALEAVPAEADRKALALAARANDLERRLRELERQLARRDFEQLLAVNLKETAGVKLVAARVEAADVAILREMCDWFRDRIGSGVVVLGTVINDKPNVIAAVTDDLVKRGLNAGDLVKQLGRYIGGGGGGRPTLAQAGGKDPSRLAEALAQVENMVSKALA